MGWLRNGGNAAQTPSGAGPSLAGRFASSPCRQKRRAGATCTARATTPHVGIAEEVGRHSKSAPVGQAEPLQLLAAVVVRAAAFPRLILIVAELSGETTPCPKWELLDHRK